MAEYNCGTCDSSCGSTGYTSHAAREMLGGSSSAGYSSRDEIDNGYVSNGPADMMQDGYNGLANNPNPPSDDTQDNDPFALDSRVDNEAKNLGLDNKTKNNNVITNNNNQQNNHEQMINNMNMHNNQPKSNVDNQKKSDNLKIKPLINPQTLIEVLNSSKKEKNHKSKLPNLGPGIKFI